MDMDYANSFGCNLVLGDLWKLDEQSIQQDSGDNQEYSEEKRRKDFT
jgi:hypothetical protein